MTHPNPIDAQEYRDHCIAVRAQQIGPPTPISPQEEVALHQEECRLSWEVAAPWRCSMSFDFSPPRIPMRKRPLVLAARLLGLSWKPLEVRQHDAFWKGMRHWYRRWDEARQCSALARQAEYEMLVAMMDAQSGGGE